MSTCHAVLLETVSIQKYVFQSNKLKENLGASALVENIYQGYLQEAVKQVTGNAVNIDAWKTASDSDSDIGSKPFEIGYIGGGNALLFFQEESPAQRFLETWTKLLLVQTPGIVTAAALNPFDFSNFPESRKKLFDILRDNKQTCIPNTVLPRHGITADCPHSGLSMEIWNDEGPWEERGYVSAGTYAKIQAAKQSHKIDKEFCLTDQLDQLGKIRGEDSHIAVVHIDGNDMGKRFQATTSLAEMRMLATTVKQATDTAFASLSSHIVQKYDGIMTSLGFDDQSGDPERRYPRNESRKQKILPIRPIIQGGDDITFVCDGKLGIYFAKIFMEAFQEQPVSDGQPLTACAGVAVIKTKYPFSRGYNLAEALCGHAKDVRRGHNDDSHSYLDFHISMGGISGSLEDIRRKNFQVTQGNLLYRPYKLVPKESHDVRSFDLCVENAAKLKRDFPNNKIKELRQVLTLSRAAAEQFVQEMRYRDRQLPRIPGRSFEVALFENQQTPYYDMIELLELYPKFAFETDGGKL